MPLARMESRELPELVGGENGSRLNRIRIDLVDRDVLETGRRRLLMWFRRGLRYCLSGLGFAGEQGRESLAESFAILWF